MKQLRRTALAAMFGASFGACFGVGAALPAFAQDADLIEAARGTLASLQDASFRNGREYCGMIGRNPDGQLVITRPRRGRANGCLPRNFLLSNVRALASYHTHGGHQPFLSAEVPSSYDLRADKGIGVFGFVATPGGRFWVTEPDKNQVRLICQGGCMPKDPSYDAASGEQVRLVYSAQELRNRERGLDD